MKKAGLIGERERREREKAGSDWAAVLHGQDEEKGAGTVGERASGWA